MKKKLLAAVVAVALVACCVIGGTLAWLTAETDPVVNTFTVGNIDITLTETPATYKILPGTEIAKDPNVTVDASSEDCWLFVKVDEANWPEKVEYSIDSAWTPLDGVDGVYYIDTPAKGTAIPVLTDNEVVVLDTMTKQEVNAIQSAIEVNPENAPSLTFTAYAVQKEGFATAELAWAEAQQ